MHTGRAADTSQPGSAQLARTVGAGSEHRETAPGRDPGTGLSSDAAVPHQTPQGMPSTGTAAAREAEQALCGCAAAHAASAACGFLHSRQQVPPASPSAMSWSDSEAAIDVCMAEDTAATPTKQQAPAAAQQPSSLDGLPHQTNREAAAPVLGNLCEEEFYKASSHGLSCFWPA